MKICIATHIDRIGGVHTFLNNLINNWPKKNDQFTIILNYDFPNKKKFFKNTKKINKKFQFLFLFPKFLFLKILIFPLNLIYLFFKFLIIFKIIKFDKLMIVSGGYPLSLPNKIILLSWIIVKSTKDVIINIHNLNTKSSWKNFIFDSFIDKIISKFNIKLILVSKACINSIKKNRKVFLKHKNLKILYNGVTPYKGFKKSKIKNNKYYTCLMLATYEARKGHLFLFKVIEHALNKLKNIKLLIYGDDSSNQIPKLKRFIISKKMHKNIKLNKFSENKYELLKNSDLLIVPSQSHESFGLVIIEAMSVGVPVIANNVGGIREVISSNKFGILVNKNSIKDFSNSLIKLLTNRAKREKIIKNAKKHFNTNFKASVMSQNYFKEISKVV